MIVEESRQGKVWTSTYFILLYEIICEDFDTDNETYCNWRGSSQETYGDSNVCVYMQLYN
jgi:hypothetical protein